MKFVKIKNSTLLFLLLMAVLVMGIGYASINSVTGEIKGTLTANSQEGVFITDVTYVSDVGAKLSNCKISKYAGTMMQSTVELSNTNVSSSITYKVTIYNAYKTEAQFAKTIYDNEFYDNQDITFEISGFKPGDIIKSKETKDIIITFKYKGSTIPSNKVLNSYLNFKMEKINRMMVAGDGEETATYLSSSIAKNKIESMKFIKGKDIPSTATNIFDASESKDESIIGYYTDDDNNGLYELTLISEGTIYTNTNASYLFYYMTNLKSIDFGNFNTTGSLSMSNMFSYCESLTTIDVSSFDTSNVTDMFQMFCGCESLTTIDLSSFDTSNVTNMSYMFGYCSSLTTIDLSSFDTSKVTDMSSMFSHCRSLTTIDLSSFDTSKVTDMGSMFSYCRSLTTIDLSLFNTSNVTNIHYMFGYCSSLTTIDLSSFDTSKVTDMGYMFYNCSSLTTIDLSSFDTSKVTDMSYMFYNCRSLTTIDLSLFNTSNVTNMSCMFNSSSLTTIDLSSFDTSKVTDMMSMFGYCSSLTTIYVKEYNPTTNKGWTTATVTKSSNMFYKCINLVGENGTKYSSANTDATYARIDKDGEPGYLSVKITNPYLPSGFTYVAGTTLKNGLTIQDSKGNQYVWVEVPQTTTVYPTAGLNITTFNADEYTKIETDLHTYTNDYRISGYEDKYGSHSDEMTGLTSEEYYELKKKMLKSVYQNGGFYVGKYETGIEGAPKTSGSSTTAPAEIPVIKKNAYPYSNVTCSQARTLASNMEAGNYTSSLMFGVQWNLVLKYLETKGTAQADLKTNSTNWGNYRDNLWNITNANSKYAIYNTNTYKYKWTSGAYGKRDGDKRILLSTGASETFSKQGIYDLAGNVEEWTLEYVTVSREPCAVRGGSCYVNGSDYTADSGIEYVPNICSGDIGFRVSIF